MTGRGGWRVMCHVKRFCALLLLVFAVFASTGCSAGLRQGLPESFVGVTPPADLAPLMDKMAREGERNWVLNLNTLAIASLRRGDRELARRALDESLLQIEIIYGGSDQAARARSAFYEEGSKIFKGDPYERSMAYFYRGILYLQDGVYDQARACFRSAGFMDSVAEDTQFNDDWSIFNYMVGVCETQLRRPSHANDAFTLARDTYASFAARYYNLQQRPTGMPPFENRLSQIQFAPDLMPFYPHTNLLVITQTGRAPRKVAAGAYGEFLAYAPGGGGAQRTILRIDGENMGPVPPVDSLYYQAVTRGGRELDKVLGRKAVFKDVTGGVAAAGIFGGAILLNEGLEHDNDEQAYVGAAAIGTGLASAIISALIKPQADTRAWYSLPDSIGLFTGTVEPGTHILEINYGAAPYMPAEDAAITFNVPPPGQGVAVILAFPPPQPYLVAPQTSSNASLDPGLDLLSVPQ